MSYILPFSVLYPHEAPDHHNAKLKSCFYASLLHMTVDRVCKTGSADDVCVHANTNTAAAPVARISQFTALAITDLASLRDC